MIQESTIIEDAVQRDGRRFITERHVDDSGAVTFVRYMAEAKATIEDMLPIRAAQIEQQDADRKAILDAIALAEKERAIELLKLADASLAKVLMVPVEKVADEKAALTKQTADVVVDGKLEGGK